jgi:hypothetical protein
MANKEKKQNKRGKKRKNQQQQKKLYKPKNEINAKKKLRFF